MKIFKIQDGGRPLYLKPFFGHNSAADCPISVKFCVGKQIIIEVRQWNRYPHSTKRMFCFPNAVLDSASGGFRITSYALLLHFIGQWCGFWHSSFQSRDLWFTADLFWRLQVDSCNRFYVIIAGCKIWGKLVSYRRWGIRQCSVKRFEPFYTLKSNQNPIKSEKLTIAPHHQSSGALVTAD